MISQMPGFIDEEYKEFEKFEDLLKDEEIYQNNKVLKNIKIRSLVEYMIQRVQITVSLLRNMKEVRLLMFFHSLNYPYILDLYVLEVLSNS